MRRTLLLGLLATLLLAPTARATGTQTILRDCQDDDVLQGHYSVNDLRKARSNIPGDQSEYGDCYDVISRAIAAGLSSSGSKTGSGSSAGGGANSGNGGTNTGSGGSSPSVTAAPTPAPTIVRPTTPQDTKTLAEAATHGYAPTTVDDSPLTPGTRVAADLGHNRLPPALIAVLALLVAAALAAVSPTIRRRVVTHRKS
jgi:hypothetical protein